MRKKLHPPVGRPLALDPSVRSTSQNDPAFIARPEGSPVYYGFQILSDVVVEGFAFGKITDFEAELCSEGDAFVVAPDNNRAGLVWEVSDTAGGFNGSLQHQFGVYFLVVKRPNPPEGVDSKKALS